jgi:CheY-like chemotaxis protein
LLTTELTSAGYRVIAAANGAEAVALFRAHLRDIRLFITDNAMPNVDGLEAVAALRKMNPELPVILTSGDIEAAETTGFSVVNKPFSLEEILLSIQQNLFSKKQ